MMMETDKYEVNVETLEDLGQKPECKIIDPKSSVNDMTISKQNIESSQMQAHDIPTTTMTSEISSTCTGASENGFIIEMTKDDFSTSYLTSHKDENVHNSFQSTLSHNHQDNREESCRKNVPVSSIRSAINDDPILIQSSSDHLDLVSGKRDLENGIAGRLLHSDQWTDAAENVRLGSHRFEAAETLSIKPCDGDKQCSIKDRPHVPLENQGERNLCQFKCKDTLRKGMENDAGESTLQYQGDAKAFDECATGRCSRNLSNGQPGTLSVEKSIQGLEVIKLISLEKNMKLPTGKNPFWLKCAKCGMSFNGQVLKNHSKMHTVERPHKCEECGMTFAKKSHFKRHMIIHTGERPFKCEQCGKAFNSRGILKNHMKIHSGPREKPFKCLECGKAFSVQWFLTNHMKIHTGEKPFKCLECGKAFINDCSLKSHLITHMKEKPFKCKECGRDFAVIKYLKNHMRFMHSGENPFQCEECGKAFNRLCSLKKHMITHSEEKPFKCLECGMCFHLQCLLKKHMITHSEKTFNCKECDKGFATKSYLKNHMKMHTGEKPFQCEECGKAFFRKCSVKNHMKIHSPHEPDMW